MNHRDPGKLQPELTQAAIDDWLEHPRRGRHMPAVQVELARRTLAWWKGRRPSVATVMRGWDDDDPANAKVVVQFESYPWS